MHCEVAKLSRVRAAELSCEGEQGLAKIHVLYAVLRFPGANRVGLTRAVIRVVILQDELWWPTSDLPLKQFHVYLLGHLAVAVVGHVLIQRTVIVISNNCSVVDLFLILLAR